MKGILLLLLTCFLWATDTLIRYPLFMSGTSAVTIVFYEHLLLVLLLGVFFYQEWRAFWDAKLSQIFSFVIIGMGGSALGTIAFTQAFQTLDPSVVILLQKLQPIIAVIAAAIILGETISKTFIFFGLVSMVGAVLVSFDTISEGANALLRLNFGRGHLWALLSVFLWGISTVFGKKLLSEGFNQKQLLLGRFTMGLLLLIPTVLYWDFSLSISAMSLGKISAMVLLSGILGMYFYYLALAKLSARLTALVELFFPFCAIVINWLFLNSTLTMMQLIGAGMLLGSALIIQLRKI